MPSASPATAIRRTGGVRESRKGLREDSSRASSRQSFQPILLTSMMTAPPGACSDDAWVGMEPDASVTVAEAKADANLPSMLRFHSARPTQNALSLGIAL